MQIVETVADELALEALDVIRRTGNDKIVEQVSEVIGASSSTMQEAFLTAVRVRRAEERARKLLVEIRAGLSETPADDG